MVLTRLHAHPELPPGREKVSCVNPLGRHPLDGRHFDVRLDESVVVLVHRPFLGVQFVVARSPEMLSNIAAGWHVKERVPVVEDDEERLPFHG